MVIKQADIKHLCVMAELESIPPPAIDIKAVLALDSAQEPSDLTSQILNLSSALRRGGFEKHAEELEQKFVQYKTADVHLYRVHDEDGDDLVDRAHPDGDVNVGDGEHGDVETISSKHKKIVDVIRKQPTGKLGAYVAACKVVLGQKGINLKGLPVSDVAKPIEGVVPFSSGQVANSSFINQLLSQHLRKYTTAFTKLAEVGKLLSPFPSDEVSEATKQSVARTLYLVKSVVNMSEESFSEVEKKVAAIEAAKMAVTKDPAASVVKMADIAAAFANTSASKLNYQHANDFNDLNDRIGQVDKQLFDMINALKPLFQSGNQAASKVNDMAANLVTEAAASLQ